jgi:hypothetical protein
VSELTLAARGSTSTGSPGVDLGAGDLYVSEDRGERWQVVGQNLPPIDSVRLA